MLVSGSFLQQDWINALGWALLHSLWQHALIAVCCAILLSFSKHSSAHSRYLIAFSGIVLATLTSTITFYKYHKSSTEIVMQPLPADKLIPQLYETDVLNVLSFINAHIGNITLFWIFGIAVYGLKILLAYRHCQKLKNNFLTATPEKWEKIFVGLAEKIGLSSCAELRISLIANTPCVIGHIKPVVLLPMKLLLGMNQQQIEAIILHELAHIRRQDYLLGIIQTLIKALFFFNPFLHWISAQIDKEREYACDDIAVAICQNPLLFANTLKELAEMNTNQTIAMKITGNKLLLPRITRLFNRRGKQTPSKNNLAASILILLSSLAFTLCVNATPDITSNKAISLNVADRAVNEVLEEVNKKCGTFEVLPTQNDGNVTLVLKDISCKDAIKLLKDFASEAPPKE